MKRPLLVAISMLLVVGTMSAGLPASTKGAQVQKLITDPHVWGDDGFAALASIYIWKNSGETGILVYTDRVVGRTRYATLAEAQRSAARVSATLKSAGVGLRPPYSGVYRDSIARAASFTIRAERFLEDDSFRVVMRSHAGQFLRPGLKMGSVEQTFGTPERTTTEVVQALGDRRPAVLAVHSYAGGAVEFIESDLSPTPGFVDRISVDVALVYARLF